MKNKMEDLRNHLFATLEALQDEASPMDIDRAKAIADVAKQVVDTAKVEVDFVKATGNDMASGFLPIAQQDQRPPLALKRGA